MNSSLYPKAKVVAGGIGGAVSTLIIWLLQTYGNVELSAEITGAIVTIIGFISAYMTAEK